MRSPIWKIDEILNMPEFGGKIGWFYGFIWYENELYFGEIYPGLGFTKEFDIWYPEEEKPVQTMFWTIGRIFKDVWWRTFKYKGGEEMAKRKDEDFEFEPKSEEGPEEPADDTAEAQPSIEREDAATGRTGSGSPGAGESGGIGSAGNPS